MKMSTVNIIIERDPMTKIPKAVWAWEVPVFRSKYGDEKIEILGAGPDAEVDDDFNAQDEYFAMRLRFGIDTDTKQSHADLVYGRGQEGVDKLEKAIAAGKGGDVKAAQKVVDGKSKPSPDVVAAREAAERDPLGDEFVDQRFADQAQADIVGAASGGPGDVSEKGPKGK